MRAGLCHKQPPRGGGQIQPRVHQLFHAGKGIGAHAVKAEIAAVGLDGAVQLKGCIRVQGHVQRVVEHHNQLRRSGGLAVHHVHLRKARVGGVMIDQQCLRRGKEQRRRRAHALFIRHIHSNGHAENTVTRLIGREHARSVRQAHQILWNAIGADQCNRFAQLVQQPAQRQQRADRIAVRINMRAYHKVVRVFKRGQYFLCVQVIHHDSDRFPRFWGRYRAARQPHARRRRYSDPAQTAAPAYSAGTGDGPAPGG